MEREFSSGGLVLRRIDEKWHLAVIEPAGRESESGKPLLALPKGWINPGEKADETALREVREETLIENLEFAWGEVYTQTNPYSRGKVARYYIAKTTTVEVSLPVIEALGRAEHNEFRWVDREAALRLVSPRVAPIIEWADGYIEPRQNSLDVG